VFLIISEEINNVQGALLVREAQLTVCAGILGIRLQLAEEKKNGTPLDQIFA
jgi:hypothetical protein